MILLLIPALPLLAALYALVPNQGRVAGLATVLAACGAAALAGIVAARGATGVPSVAFPNLVSCDSLGALVLVLVAAVNLSASVFSWGYVPARLAPENLRAQRRYYIDYNLFAGSLLLVPLIAEPALAWIAIELTTLLSVFLVGFDRTRGALQAAWKYVAITLMGAAIALLGLLLLYWAFRSSGSGTFTWNGLLVAAPRMPSGVVRAGFLLVLVGFGAKIGLVPLHTWIPDAYHHTPSPVCALLSGAEATVVLYSILRLIPVAVAVSAPEVGSWLLGFGLLSVGAAAFLILQTHDFKRVFAYSTIEHMGIILVAAGLGGSLATYGAVAQVLTHSITKVLCFLAAGAAVIVTAEQDTRKVRGLLRASPVTGAALLIGGLAIAGAPPLAVFLSEFAILRAGLAGGHAVVVAMLSLFVTIGFFAVMGHVNHMVFGLPLRFVEHHPLPASCVVALVVASVPVVVFGLYVPTPVFQLLHHAALLMGR